MTGARWSPVASDQDSTRPEEVRSLIAELFDRGFEIADHRYGDMGGERLMLQGPEGALPRATVEIVGDRGSWTLGLGFAEVTGFVDPRVWAAVIGNEDFGPPTLERRSQALLQHLDTAQRAAATTQDIARRLKERGEAHMRRELGLD